MKKINKKIIFSILPIFPLITTPLLISSCSNTDKNIDKNFIDKQYEYFQKAKLLYDELFFNYFNLKDNQDIEVGLEEVNQFLTTSELSNNGLINDFNLKREGSNLVVTYNLKNNKKQNLEPTNTKNKSIVIENVKELDETKIDDISSRWTNFKTNIKIKNGTSELEIAKYSTILPSYLDNYDYFSESLNSFKTSNLLTDTNGTPSSISDNDISKFEYFFEIYCDDEKGNISILLQLINKDNGMKVNLSTNVLENFAKKETRDKEIVEAYKQLGVSYDLKLIDKEIKQYASSLYDIESIREFFISLKGKGSFVLPDFFDNDKNSDLWYTLDVEINANDQSGYINITFTMIDKFTKNAIKPQNITTIMTITNFVKASNGVEIDGKTKYDNSIIENIYKAYEVFNNIELKSEEHFKKLPSSESSISIDKSWLETNTNIDAKYLDMTNGFEIESNIYYSNDETNKDKKRKNKFRIKMDKSFKTIINDDTNGIKKTNILLEMQGENDTNKWHVVLPSETKSGNGKDAVYSTKTANQKFIQIGKYRTKNIDDVAKVYSAFEDGATNGAKTLEIQVSNDELNEILNDNTFTQFNLLEKFKNPINELFKEIIEEKYTTNDEGLDLVSKYTYKIELNNNPLKYKIDNSNKIENFSTDEVEIKIVPINNLDDVQDYYKQNTSTKANFPKIKIVGKII